MLLARELNPWRRISEEKPLALQPEETVPEDRWKHPGPLQGLLQFRAKRRRKKGKPSVLCRWVAERTWPRGQLFSRSPGEAIARGVQLFPPAQV